MTSQPTVVWTEIPVVDMEKSVEFYNSLFGWQMTIDTSGPNPMANFDPDLMGISGHLYPGKPATDGNGPTIHLAVDVLENAMQRCKDAGGAVLSPPIEIPPGRFAYAQDLDGNSLGLFEPKAMA